MENIHLDNRELVVEHIHLDCRKPVIIVHSCEHAVCLGLSAWE